MRLRKANRENKLKDVNQFLSVIGEAKRGKQEEQVMDERAVADKRLVFHLLARDRTQSCVHIFLCVCV